MVGQAKARRQARTPLQKRQAKVFATFREFFGLTEPGDIIQCLRKMGIKVWKISKLTEEQVEMALTMLEELEPIQHSNVRRNVPAKPGEQERQSA